MAPILESLNAAQRAAVTSPSNVLQILAPPGSGKTKTLTSRVAYLLRHCRYKPCDIICLTFTIKSSREMKERIAKLIGNGIESQLILGTFHSVCRRYLVAYGHHVGVNKGFGIADMADSLSIIKRITKRRKLNIDPRKAQSRISSSKSKGISHTELVREQAKQKSVDQQEFITVFEEYEYQLAQSNLLDYDDLLLRCVDLLRSHPTCVDNVECVLIDEFQDTNIVQFDLMRLFAAENKRITTVGDPDQSIYGWRSAEIKNLKRMQKQYPDTLVIHLEENYRSSGTILLAASEIIEQDESRPQKSLSPTHCPGTVPVLRRLPSAEAEAAWTVSEIQRIMGLTGNLVSPSDFAILLRSASLSRLLESAMGKAGIPYRMVGGQKFFDRVEVKILLDYLRVISQPNHNDALVRILNVPARGLGPATSKALLEEAESKGKPLWTFIREIVQGHTTTKTKLFKAAEQGLGAFSSIVITTKKKLKDTIEPSPPEGLLRHLIQKLDIETHLKKVFPKDHETRWANVEELVAQASGFPISIGNEESAEQAIDALPIIEGIEQQSANVSEEALSRFLANVALATEVQRENDENEDGTPQSQVTISTIHAAKGLEWPVVFIPSTYDGIIPHSRAEDTDEERRLLYVAMTRAQALLYMSCPTRSSQREETTLSPFLSDKKVKRFLTNQAPLIGTGEVVDIARILRRDYPSEVEIVQASRGLRSVYDNLWPLCGEENVETAQVRWGRDSAKGNPRFADQGQMVEDARFSAAKTYQSSAVGFTTTIQNAYACNQGFTTATAQMQQTYDRKRRERSASVDNKNREVKSKKQDGKSAKPQGNLFSVWDMKAQPRATHHPVPKPTQEPVFENLSKRRDPTVSEVEAILLNAPTNHPRHPLAAIPETLANHRLEPLNQTHRPKTIVHEDNPANKPYIFLSSSPPQPEATTSPQMADIDDLEAAMDPKDRDFAPANTFHTTSVTRVHAAKALPKTLGVRRSMNGWSARQSQGFSVPRMAGRKG